MTPVALGIFARYKVVVRSAEILIGHPGIDIVLHHLREALRLTRIAQIEACGDPRMVGGARLMVIRCQRKSG